MVDFAIKNQLKYNILHLEVYQDSQQAQLVVDCLYLETSPII